MNISKKYILFLYHIDGAKSLKPIVKLSTKETNSINNVLASANAIISHTKIEATRLFIDDIGQTQKQTEFVYLKNVSVWEYNTKLDCLWGIIDVKSNIPFNMLAILKEK